MDDLNPYAASSSSLPPPLQPSTAVSATLEPTAGFVSGIRWFMIANIVSLLGITISDNLSNILIPGFSDPVANFDLDGTAIAILAGLFLSFIVYLVTFITLIVLICRFMSRCNRNVRVLGATNLAYTPGWCTGWWFIPFANLVVPFRCMREIWLASETPDGFRWANQVAPSILTGWWACWIIGNLLSSLEGRLAMMMEVGVGTMVIGWISTICLIAGGIFLIKIVRGIHELQSGHTQPATEFY